MKRRGVGEFKRAGAGECHVLIERIHEVGGAAARYQDGAAAAYRGAAVHDESGAIRFQRSVIGDGTPGDRRSLKGQRRGIVDLDGTEVGDADVIEDNRGRGACDKKRGGYGDRQSAAINRRAALDRIRSDDIDGAAAGDGAAADRRRGLQLEYGGTVFQRYRARAGIGQRIAIKHQRAECLDASRIGDSAGEDAHIRPVKRKHSAAREIEYGGGAGSNTLGCCTCTDRDGTGDGNYRLVRRSRNLDAPVARSRPAIAARVSPKVLRRVRRERDRLCRRRFCRGFGGQNPGVRYRVGKAGKAFVIPGERHARNVRAGQRVMCRRKRPRRNAWVSDRTQHVPRSVIRGRRPYRIGRAGSFTYVVEGEARQRRSESQRIADGVAAILNDEIVAGSRPDHAAAVNLILIVDCDSRAGAGNAHGDAIAGKITGERRAPDGAPGRIKQVEIDRGRTVLLRRQRERPRRVASVESESGELRRRQRNRATADRQRIVFAVRESCVGWNAADRDQNRIARCVGRFADFEAKQCRFALLTKSDWR